MKFRFLSFFLLIMAVLLTNCKIGEDSPKRDFYVFEESLTLSNVKKEYIQGDFFWVEANLPKQLKDQPTGKTVEVGNATFNLNVEVVDPLDKKPDLEKFALIPQTGVFSNENNFGRNGLMSVSFGCPANDYTMKAGIQFKEKGGYLLYINKANPYFQVFFTGVSDCSIIRPNTIPPDDADVGTVRFTFAVSDSNRDKFDEYAAGFPGTTLDLEAIRASLDKKEAFFVWVK